MAIGKSVDKRTKAILEARSWLNTPWRHNRKDKGRGVDCINFLFAVGQSVGLRLPPLPEQYAKIPIKNEIEKYLTKSFVRCFDGKIKIARVLLFSFRGYKCHVGIATSDHSMIHACNFGRHQKVQEHEINGVWWQSLDSVWEVKEWSSLDNLQILGDK